MRLLAEDTPLDVVRREMTTRASCPSCLQPMTVQPPLSMGSDTSFGGRLVKLSPIKRGPTECLSVPIVLQTGLIVRAG